MLYEIDYYIVINYHGKADIGLLECGSVVGAVTRHCDHLAIVTQCTVYDAFDQRVLVLR